MNNNAARSVEIGPNALLSFAVEMLALGIYAWAPFAFLGLPLYAEIAIAAVIVVIFALLWARFAAPKSATRLQGIGLLLFKLAVFTPALVLLYMRFGWVIALVGAVVTMLNVVWEYVEGRRKETP